MDYDQPLDKDFQEDLHFSNESRANLNETAGWTKFLAIVGFIFVGFMVLASYRIHSFFSMMPMSEEFPFPPAIFSVFSVIYLGMALLFFFPVLYLYKFSTRMKDAIRASDQGAMEDAFANIKAHYKFIGILMIVLIGFNVLSFMVVVFASLVSL
jgi:hypothetical protein